MFGTKKHTKEIIVNMESLQVRIAVLEEGKLDDFYIERPSDEQIVGSIFKGKIQNLEDGLQHFGDVDAAIDWLRQKGMAKAKKKSSRVASEGLVDAYIHAGGKIGVLVEVNAETDFVALNHEFKTLVRDLAMHIAASRPLAVERDNVDPATVERERGIYLEQAKNEGKPEHIAEKIVTGRLDKYYQDICLMEQPFVKNPDQTVGDLVTEMTAKVGERISVRRFSCFRLGEDE